MRQGQVLILDLLSLDDYRAKEMSTHIVLPSSIRSAQITGESRMKHATPGISTLPVLQDYFRIMFDALGPQKWWPGRTRFEIIVGAILTQNASWTNVERAIAALRREGLLTPKGIAVTPVGELAMLIRSSGYFRQKARKLKEFVHFLNTKHGGSLNKMFATPTLELREQLLGVHGVGPETADSILLYAGKHRVFVVDAYTKRILQRHGLATEKRSYEEIQELFEKSLSSDAALFNEFHALIVYLGKHFCRPKAPECSACPLNCFLPQTIEGSR